MKVNQISVLLFRKIERHFNENHGSTKNNERFWKRMHIMYPATVTKQSRYPYDYGRMIAHPYQRSAS